MPSIASSLFWIALIAAIAPIVAGLIPRRLVPEVVLLLVAGAVVGPFALNIAADSEAIGILRELGLGMLFLLAGYEIDRQELSGRGGRRALYTWLFCLALAFTVVALLGMRNVISAEAAVAIAMTSTALGTLLPILKDNKLLDTRLGRTVLNHGAVGELGPVVAMAVLLSARGAILSLIVLAVFAVIAIIVAVLPGKLIHEARGHIAWCGQGRTRRRRRRSASPFCCWSASECCRPCSHSTSFSVHLRPASSCGD